MIFYSIDNVKILKQEILDKVLKTVSIGISVFSILFGIGPVNLNHMPSL